MPARRAPKPKPNPIALGLRWGRMLARLDCAREQFAKVAAEWDLHDPDDAKLVRIATDALGALDQRLWEREPSQRPRKVRR